MGKREKNKACIVIEDSDGARTSLVVHVLGQLVFSLDCWKLKCRREADRAVLSIPMEQIKSFTEIREERNGRAKRL